MTPPSLPPALPQWSTRQIILATIIAISLGATFWLLYQLYLVVIILFTAIIISTALKPLTDRLSGWGVSPLFSIIIIYGLITILSIIFLVSATPILFEQVTAILEAIPDYYRSIRSSMMQSPNLFLQQLSWRLPATLSLTNLSLNLGTESIDPVAQSVGAITIGVKGVFITIATLMLTVYWTLDSERTKRNLLLLVPYNHRDEAREVVDEMEAKLGAFIRGQAILCGVIGLLALIAYLIIGVPYAVALAVFAGLMEAVPYIGPALGALPALIMAASVSPQMAIWVFIATLIIQQLENTFLVPRVMNHAVGVNTFVALLAIFAFGTLGGIVGVLLAIPAAAIVQLLVDRFLLKYSAPELQNEIGRDKFSRLRYEAKDLIQDMREQIRQEEREWDGTDEKHIEEDIEAIASDLESILAQVNHQGESSK